MNASDTDDPPTVSDDAQRDELAALVREAFNVARKSGKQSWAQMTTAVLKNRLLQLTDSEFSESRYGAKSFVHLLRQLPDLLVIDSTRTPAIVTLKDQQATPPEPRGGASVDQHDSSAVRDWRTARVRDDLWRSVIDYRSGDVYVFDDASGQAVARTGEKSNLPALPTASPEDVKRWRQEFSEKTKEDHDVDLSFWAEGPGSSTGLPAEFRGPWNEFLKRRVIGRLKEWFAAKSIEEPTDLLAHDTPKRSSAPATGDVVRTQALRDALIEAIQTMDYDDLSRVMIPASYLARRSTPSS